MRISSFTITNYRSISRAYRISLDSNITVLLGKNNEGKSNILKALKGVFDIISLLRSVPKEDVKNYILSRTPRRMRRSLRSNSWDYAWERDFPIGKKTKNNF